MARQATVNPVASGLFEIQGHQAGFRQRSDMLIFFQKFPLAAQKQLAPELWGILGFIFLTGCSAEPAWLCARSRVLGSIV